MGLLKMAEMTKECLYLICLDFTLYLHNDVLSD